MMPRRTSAGAALVLTMALLVTTADAGRPLSAAEVTDTRWARLGGSAPEGRRVLQPTPGDSALVSLHLPLVTRNAMPDNHVTFAVIGEYGICGSDPAACEVEAKVADLVKSWRPDFVITTGGNSTSDDAPGRPDPYETDVRRFYGEFYDGRYFPAMGTNDWRLGEDGGHAAEPYLSHFHWLNDPEGGYTKSLLFPSLIDNGSGGRYYHFQRGSVVGGDGSRPLVHLFAIDSNLQEPHGRGIHSAQYRWMAYEMAGSDACFRIAYMHHPPFSSGAETWNAEEKQAMRTWQWDELDLDLALAGRSRNYEVLDAHDTLFLVSGLGGARQHGWGEIERDGSENREQVSLYRYPSQPNDVEYGALKVDVWSHLDVPGKVMMSAVFWVVDTSEPDPKPKRIHGVSMGRGCTYRSQR